MSKLENIWIIAESAGAAAELIAGAATLGEKTSVLRCECSESESWLGYIPAIVVLVKEHKPQLVLLDTTKNGRLTAAAIAAAIGTSVLTDSVGLNIEDSSVISKRMSYGGAAFKTEKATGKTAIACVSPGVFEAVPGQATEEITVVPGVSKARFVEKRKKESRTVNLPAAKIVIGVGRGFGKEENVQLARDLAAAIGGEVGCSRPVAEENKWIPKEHYLGVTGVTIKANVYISCGVSGQIQHIVGVNQSKAIVAINKDQSAPIFRHCDYGIVGDLTKVIPALTAKFKGH